MSQHPPERITPLPWNVKIVSYANSGKAFATVESGKHVICATNGSGVEQSKADAEYIVHCANNYPKLEALNAELASAAELLMDKCSSAALPMREFDRISALIAKAKGGV